MRRPAILGGSPLFPQGLPFVRPMLPPLDRVTARLAPSYDRGELTNGPLVRQLESQIAERLGAPEVVAVSSCTAGLMLVWRALAPVGPVVMPSFTFLASAHAVAWNGLEPRFAECDAETLQMDVADAEARSGGAGALYATHVFGAPAPAAMLEAMGRRAGTPVVFDAAHAMGARHDGRPVGTFGDAEVFSLSPTKPVTAGEGGVVVTRDRDLAEAVRVGRNYGNPGDFDAKFAGLSARLSELHAALALESLLLLDQHLDRRATLAGRYREGTRSVPGVNAQRVPAGDTSTQQSLCVMVDPGTFGLSRDQIARGLRAEGIDTRSYFSPPVHRQGAFAPLGGDPLPVTEDVSARVLSLPMPASATCSDVDTVIDALGSLHVHAEEVSQAPQA